MRIRVNRTVYEVTPGFGGSEWHIYRVRDDKYIGKVFGGGGFASSMTSSKLREEARRLVQERVK